MAGTNGLRVNRSLIIPFEELDFNVSTSGGPGGQHANRAKTRVAITFDVGASTVLGPRQRARLLSRLGPLVRTTASDERSQTRNRDLALRRLKEKLVDALRVEPPRHPTRPTKSSTVKRLEAKRRHGAIKLDRRRPEDDD
jgi:ribosome-associated protein